MVSTCKDGGKKMIRLSITLESDMSEPRLIFGRGMFRICIKRGEYTISAVVGEDI